MVLSAADGRVGRVDERDALLQPREPGVVGAQELA
jgi:hypothetical protein